MAKKHQPSPFPWRTSGAHKPNGEAVYILEDREQTPIGSIRTEGMPPEVIRANRKIIENSPRMARVLVEMLHICVDNRIPVRAGLVDLIQDITGYDARNMQDIHIED